MRDSGAFVSVRAACGCFWVPLFTRNENANRAEGEGGANEGSGELSADLTDRQGDIFACKNVE
jgi:hypothetical protein